MKVAEEGGICCASMNVGVQAGLRRSPDPGTGHAGDGHDAAALLHHHVDVGPHDLSDLTHHWRLKKHLPLVHNDFVGAEL